MAVVYDIYGISHDVRPRKRAPRKNGPTQRILAMAISAPGGVIRWRDANAAYLLGSENARRSRSNNFHMSVKRVLERHFTKVSGTHGYYVLTSSIKGDDDEAS